MEDDIRQELIGNNHPVVLEALESYQLYVAEVASDASPEGKFPEVQSWGDYLTEYLIEEIRAKGDD